MQCSKTRHCGGKGGKSASFCNTDDELGRDLSLPVFSSSACCKMMHFSPPQSAAFFVWVSRFAALYRFATAIERSISQQCCVLQQRWTCSEIEHARTVAKRYSASVQRQTCSRNEHATAVAKRYSASVQRRRVAFCYSFSRQPSVHTRCCM